MSDLTVAKTILQQLGGSHFRVMTGARNFVGSDDSLMFDLPPCDFKLKDIDRVRITLTPMDVYEVAFCTRKGGQLAVVETVEDVYCDTLRDVFERVTGLLTSLTPRRRVHEFG